MYYVEGSGGLCKKEPNAVPYGFINLNAFHEGTI